MIDWIKNLFRPKPEKAPDATEEVTLRDVIPDVDEWQTGDKLRLYYPGVHAGLGRYVPGESHDYVFEGSTEDGIVVRGEDGHLQELARPFSWKNTTNLSHRDRKLKAKLSA